MRNGNRATEDWSVATTSTVRTVWSVFLALLAIISLFPLWWMFTTAIKPASQIFAGDLTLFPRAVTFDHLRRLAESFNLLKLEGLWMS